MRRVLTNWLPFWRGAQVVILVLWFVALSLIAL